MKLKNNKKGITILSLTVTILLLIIIMGMITYVSLDHIKYRRIAEVQADLRIITEKVEEYYLKNGDLPKKEAKALSTNSLIPGTVEITESELPDEKTSSNDGSIYYLIDYDLLTDFSLHDADRAYVVNEKTHIVYVLRRI